MCLVGAKIQRIEKMKSATKERKKEIRNYETVIPDDLVIIICEATIAIFRKNETLCE